MTHLSHRRSLTVSSALAVILSVVAAGPAMAKTTTPRLAHHSTAATMMRAVAGAEGVTDPGAKNVPPRMRG
jgi:hypothetical protein